MREQRLTSSIEMAVLGGFRKLGLLSLTSLTVMSIETILTPLSAVEVEALATLNAYK